MVILGLTGSIGMGKSTAANMFRAMGLPVYDSDAAVHRLLGPGGGAVPEIARAFPDVVKDGAVDRQKLGARVFSDPAALKTLEGIVHPRVRRVQTAFLKRASARREPLAVLDVPLLFETAGDLLCDATVVVSAPPFIQRQRVLARPGMTDEKLDGVLARQMPNDEKCRRADFVVPTGMGRCVTLAHLKQIVSRLRRVRGTKWPPDAHHPIRNPHARNHPRY